MLNYLKPSTLKEMYRDINEARMGLLESLTTTDDPVALAQYRKISDTLEEIGQEYENNTGGQLWAEVALENASATKNKSRRMKNENKTTA